MSGCVRAAAFRELWTALLELATARLTGWTLVGGLMVMLHTFENGDVRDIDLTPLLTGPAFQAIATDEELFRQLHVDAEIGTISWPNGADISPATLFRHSDLVHSEAG